MAFLRRSPTHIRIAAPLASPDTTAGVMIDPEAPSLTPKAPKGRRISWWRFSGLFVVALVSAVVAYSYCQYASLKAQVLVDGGGDKSALLGYSTGKTELDWAQFTKPGDGRYNLLLLGVGGVNDQGVAHAGTYLTDSIQVLSIDTINKQYGLTSVPRDFLVTIPGHGMGKINSVYSYAEMDKVGSGGKAMRDKVGEILGVTISNFVMVDFTAAKKIVDIVGGVDITVPEAIYDSSYPADNDTSYDPFYISAGLHHLDGSTALKYMRSRHADSDFGRSKRQQEVLSAVKKKAFTLGILANPVKVSGILDELGKHVRTDLTVDMIKQIIAIYKDIPSDTAVQGGVLDTSAALGLLTSGMDPVAGSVEYPLKGISNYTDIQHWFQKVNPDPLIKKEAATITLRNATGVTASQLEKYAKTLEEYGFSVTTDYLATGTEKLSRSKVIATNSKKPVSAQYLSTILGTTISTSGNSDALSDITVIYAPTVTSTPTPTSRVTPTP